jgi:hypothetical protein
MSKSQALIKGKHHPCPFIVQGQGLTRGAQLGWPRQTALLQNTFVVSAGKVSLV